MGNLVSKVNVIEEQAEVVDKGISTEINNNLTTFQKVQSRFENWRCIGANSFGLNWIKFGITPSFTT